MPCSFCGYTEDHPGQDWHFVRAWPLKWHCYTLDELNAWASGGGVCGLYAWKFETEPNEVLREDRVIVGLSDPNTAVQFKLRFDRQQYGPGS